MRRIVSSAVIFLLAIATGLPLGAQEYGQWSWAGWVEADWRSWESEMQNATVRDYDDRIFRLNLGVRGYVIDPLLAEFQIGVDAAMNEVSPGVDSDSIGYRGRLRALPRSSWPVELYLEKQVWDFAVPESGDPLASHGLSSGSTGWGGRALLRAGPLAGTTLSVDHFEQDRVGDKSVSDRNDREAVSWSRGSDRYQHNASLQHRIREYGTFDFRHEDLMAAFTERGTPSARTRWHLNGSAYGRTSEIGSNSMENRTYRFGGMLVRQLGESNSLSTFYDFGGVEPDGGSFVQSHRLGGRYQHQLTEFLSLSPFAAWSVRRAGDQELRAPEVGVQSTWARSFAATDLSVSGSVSWLDSTLTSDGRQVDRTEIGLGAAASLTHRGRSLRKTLDVSFVRNELDAVGDPIPELPDLGTDLQRGGLSDSVRVRGSLGRRLGICSIDAWLEWLERESGNITGSNRYESEGLTWSLQIGFPRGIVSGFATSTELETDQRPQNVSSVSIASTFTLWRSLRLTSNWTSSVTELNFGPDVDRDRIEAGLQLGVGLIIIDFRGWEMNESATIDTIDRGATASVRRTFGGWLPIVSAPERRGGVQ